MTPVYEIQSDLAYSVGASPKLRGRASPAAVDIFRPRVGDAPGRDDALAKMLAGTLVRTVDALLRTVAWDLRAARLNTEQSRQWDGIRSRWTAMLALHQDPVRLLREAGSAADRLAWEAIRFRELALAIPANPYVVR